MIGFSFLYICLCIAGTIRTTSAQIRFFSLIFLIIIGFRGASVGVDTKTYIEMYDSIGQYGYNGYPEPLFGIAILIFNKLHLGYLSFQIFIAGVTVLNISRVAINKSYRPLMALFLFFALYFVFYSMNISRQMLAVSFILSGYACLEEKNSKKFILYIGIAFLIHYISILALSILWIKRFSLQNKTKVLVLIFGSLILGAILSNNLILTLLNPIFGDYTKYLFSDGTNGFRADSRLFLSLSLCIFWINLLIIIISCCKKKILNSLWFKIYFVSIIVSNLTMRMELGLRVTLLFNISQIILFPLFVKESRFKSPRTSYGIIVVFVTVFFFLFLSNNSAGILPYKII